MAEQLFCKQLVGGSIPFAGSKVSTQVSGANRDGGGTGLGLALSRQLVELHGGCLWLESGIDQGSSVHISLPINAAAAPLPDRQLPQLATLLQK